MSANSRRELEKNLKTLASLEAAIKMFRQLPFEAANYYANGGPGVGQAVVGDRFQGQGNSRFEPLSYDYARWKSGNARQLNKAQKAKYGKGSKLIDVAFKSTTGVLTGYGTSKNLPILVLSGALRAAINSRSHSVELVGDVGWVTFKNLPKYALYHHDPKTAPFPKRSPVEPNYDDVERVKEFLNRKISALVGNVNQQRVAFGGSQARILL